MEINKIYNEKNTDTMCKMPNDFIDLVVTSPPYDNLRKYKNRIDKSWNENEWKQTIKDLYRVIKPGGIIAWIIGDATIDGSESGTSFKQALYAIECGFKLHDTMIFKRINPMPSAGDKLRYKGSFDYIFIFSKGKPKTFNPICNEKNIKLHNVFEYLVGGKNHSDDQYARKHEAPHPEKLFHDLIVSFSNQNELIYDPYMGSGTCAKMSLKNNRKYIGSEISIEYVNLSNERINHYLKQPKLF